MEYLLIDRRDQWEALATRLANRLLFGQGSWACVKCQIIVMSFQHLAKSIKSACGGLLMLKVIAIACG